MDPQQLAALMGANPESPEGGVGTDYAQALGYSPTPVPAPSPSPTPAPTPDPSFGFPAIVDPFGGSAGSAPGPATPPSQPSSSTPASPSAPEPAVAPGTSLGVSAEKKALNTQTLDKLETRGKKPGGIQGQLAQAQADTQREYNPLIAEAHSATDLEAKAVADQAQVEADKASSLAESKSRIGAAQLDFQAKEQAAQAQAQAESRAAMADYKAAQADFAAAKVNPKDLWDNAGSTGQFAMIATAFMHDFLGARGIQTSGMDSIRSAIQNNINAQIQNIAHKRDVAQGFKEIWDMQRAQSATDAEARQRVFGFYLDGLTNQLSAEAAKYDSPLALAKGKSAIAKLQQEQADNDLKVQQHIDAAAHARQQTAVSIYSANLTASTQLEVARIHAASELAKAKKAAQVNPAAGLLFDRNHEAYRRFLPDVEKATQDKLRQSSQAIGHTADSVEKIIDLQNQIDKVPPTSVLNKLLGEKERAAEQLRNIIKMSVIYDNSGKAINEQEIKMYDELLAKKDWLTNGNNVRVLGIFAKNLLDKQDSILNGISTEISPDDVAFGAKAGDRQFDPAGSALADIRAQPGSGEHVNTETDNSKKALHSPEAFKTAESPDNSSLVRYHQLLTDQPFLDSLPGSARTAITDTVRRKDVKFDGGIPSPVSGQEAPDNAFVELEKLADKALAGDINARQAIHQLATESVSDTGLKNQDLLRAYAMWEEGQLHEKLSAQGQEDYTPEEAARQVPPGSRTFPRNDGTIGSY